MIKKTRLHPPYKNGKPFFKKRNKPGVYLIYNYQGELLYVGYSGYDLYKTMYRHFQNWNDKKQIRVTYNPDNVQVRVIYTNSPKQANDLETALIIKKMPKDNPMKLWLNNTTDAKEDKIYKEFEEAPTMKSEEYRAAVNYDPYDIDIL